MSASAVPNTAKLEEVAQILLDSGYILSALELHQELLEDGIEVSSLKKRFDAQPDTVKKTETSKNNETTTISSAQKDALLKERDELKERLLQVQADLRAAKDTVNALKYQMSKQSTTKSAVITNVPDIKNVLKESADSHEIRAMNYLTRRYLVDQGFKLTAIQFDQEVNDQDLSDWASVGLNMAEPPNLLTFFRHFVKSPTQQQAQKSDSTEDTRPKERSVIADAPKSDGPTTKFNAGYKRTRLNYSSHAPKIEMGDIPPEDAENHARVAQELIKVVSLSKDEQSLVRVAGDSLPHIVPGVILKRREELIPLTISVINKHPEKGTRFALTQLLFNLTKKPIEFERKMIVDGFIALAKIIGEERTETELLPQCWEEVGHKHPERRVLVAETCGALAQYVRSELRPSLIFSILYQLVGDKETIVREAVARNLGLLISLFEGDDKYPQMEDLFFQLLYDPELEVRAAAQRHTLPFLIDWADMTGVLCTRLANRFVTEIYSIVQKPAFGSQNVESDSQKLGILFTSISLVLPRIRESVLLSAPFAASLKLGDNNNSFVPAVLDTQTDKLLQSKFDELLTKDSNAKWAEFDWILEKFIPKILQTIVKVDVSNGQTIQGIVNVLSRICQTMGLVFTNVVLKRLIQPELEKIKKEEQAARGKIIPVYVGILAGADVAEFVPLLKDLIVALSTQDKGWLREQVPILKDTLRMICKSTSKTPQVLNLLWELIVHPANFVRACVATLFNGIIPVLNPEEVVKKVLPALVTLGSDPDKIVRFASLQALGNVAMNIEDAQIFEKIKVQFNTFMDDESHSTRYEIVKIFTHMIPTVQSTFRDTFILPRLVILAQKNHKHNVPAEKNQLTMLLFESFRAFNGLIDEDAIRDHIVPGLKVLLLDAEGLDASYRSMIHSMITDMEAAISSEPTRQPPAKSTSLPSNASGWGFGINLGMDKLKNMTMTTRKG